MTCRYRAQALHVGHPAQPLEVFRSSSGPRLPAQVNNPQLCLFAASVEPCATPERTGAEAVFP